MKINGSVGRHWVQSPVLGVDMGVREKKVRKKPEWGEQ